MFSTILHSRTQTAKRWNPSVGLVHKCEDKYEGT
jgi:hypothetical protein